MTCGRRPRAADLARGSSLALLLVLVPGAALDVAPVRHRLDVPGSPAPARVTIGFFPQWGIYRRGFTLAAAVREGEIAHLTDLVYAFGGVQPVDGPGTRPVAGRNPVVCRSTDPWADYRDRNLPAIAGTPAVAPDGLAGNFQQLRALKARDPHLRILLSLGGGGTASTDFSAAARTAVSRAAFVASCIDRFIRGDLPGLPPGAVAGIFDGFDLDWESPGPGTPAWATCPCDGPDQALLVATFRHRLDALGNVGGAPFTLTVELPASPSAAQGVQVATIAPLISDAVVMAYDFHGPWAPRGPTGFNSDLNPVGGASGLSAAGAVAAYEAAGLPASRIVLGLPLYGHDWRGVPPGPDFGLGEPAAGPAVPPGRTEAGARAAGLDPLGTADYYELASLRGFAWHEDRQAGASWLYDPARRIFWSVESPTAIRAAGRFVVARGLAGAALWELAGDRGDQLTAALAQGLRSG